MLTLFRCCGTYRLTLRLSSFMGKQKKDNIQKTQQVGVSLGQEQNTPKEKKDHKHQLKNTFVFVAANHKPNHPKKKGYRLKGSAKKSQSKDSKQALITNLNQQLQLDEDKIVDETDPYIEIVPQLEQQQQKTEPEYQVQLEVVEQMFKEPSSKDKSENQLLTIEITDSLIVHSILMELEKLTRISNSIDWIKPFFDILNPKILRKLDLGQLSFSYILHYLREMKQFFLKKLSRLEKIDQFYNYMEQIMDHKQIQKSIEMHFQQVLNNKLIEVTLQSLCLLYKLPKTASKRFQYYEVLCKVMQYMRESDFLLLMYESKRYLIYFPYHVFDEMCLKKPFSRICEINLVYIKKLFLEIYESKYCLSTYSPFFSAQIMNIKGSIEISLLDIQKSLEILSSDISLSHVEAYQKKTLEALGRIHKILSEKIPLNTNEHLQAFIDYFFIFNERYFPTDGILENIYNHRRLTNNISLNKIKYENFLNCLLKKIKREIGFQITNTAPRELNKISILILEQLITQVIDIQPEIICKLKQSLKYLSTPNLCPKLNNAFQKVIQKKTSDLISLRNVIVFFTNYKNQNELNIQPLQTLTFEILSKHKKQVDLSQKKDHTWYDLFRRMLSHPILSNWVDIQWLLPRVQEQLQSILKEPKTFFNILDRSYIDFGILLFELAKKVKIDKNLVREFAQKKIIYLINSLNDDQYYPIFHLIMEINHDDLKIYELLFSSLSVFVIKVGKGQDKQRRQYYIKSEYKEEYNKIITLTMKMSKTLKQIKNKRCFIILQKIFALTWNYSEERDLLTFLFILETKSHLTREMKTLLNSYKFDQNNLRSEDFFYLKQFSCETKQGGLSEDELSTQQLKENIKNFITRNDLTKKEINNFFKNEQIYKTIFFNKDLNPSFEIPDPRFQQQSKIAYICQRIYQKIVRKNNFSLSRIGQEQCSVNKVDLNPEIQYIKQKKLIDLPTINEFHIEHVDLPVYFRMELWDKNFFIDQKLKIQDPDLNDKTQDKTLAKILESLFGKVQKIVEFNRLLHLNRQTSKAMQKSNVFYRYNGSMITLNSTEKPQVIIFSADKNYYKCMYICAYIMRLKGKCAYVVDDSEDPNIHYSYLAINYGTYNQQQDNNLNMTEQISSTQIKMKAQ